MIDYGLVRRDRCACGLAIVIASNASPALIHATMSYHNGTREHRYWATYTQLDPAASSAPRPMTGPGAIPREDAVREIRSPVAASDRRPGSRGGVNVRADGYDFDV